MDWKNKMRLGIELIHEGCEMFSTSAEGNCNDCPFDKICDVLVDAYQKDASIFGTPDTWDI